MRKGIILAGGRGVRLRPFTDDIPKPMVKVGARPFLEYQIEMLKRYGISEIVLCVGYLKEKIISYFGDGSGFGVKIDYSIEKDFLGTGGALKIAQRYLPEEFMLLYGDSYLPIDYEKLIKFYFQRQDILGVVVCYDNKTKIAENNIFLDKNGFITRYNKRLPDKEMNYVEAGVSILKKDIIDLIPEGKTVSLEEEIFPRLIQKRLLIGYPISQRFYDIGTPDGLKQIEEVLN